MNKSDSRILYLQKRLNLSNDHYRSLNRKITEHFLHYLPESTDTVHIYLPINEKNEPDTWPIIRALWALGRNVVVPVMDPLNSSLTSWNLAPDTILQKNDWGIPEPVSSSIAEANAIDLVVLPLLAFDRQGYRVGYGKGYYDKYLAGFGHQPIKVGLSFFDPLDKIDDRNAQDIPMDICITPSGLIKF